jgi:hypothetical protein
VEWARNPDSISVILSVAKNPLGRSPVCHCEGGEADRGNPAGLLRRYAPRNDRQKFIHVLHAIHATECSLRRARDEAINWIATGE